MAKGADGSITIDTQLDNTGFKRGTQQMENAANGLVKATNQIGRNMASAIQSANPALRDLRQNLQSGAQALQNMGAGEFSRTITDMQKQAGVLANQFSRLGDSETLGVKSEAQMARFSLTVDKARDTLGILIGELNRFANQPINTAEYEKLQAEFERLDAGMEKLYQKQNMMQQLGVKEDSSQYQRLAFQIEALGKEYDTVVEKMRVMRESGSYAQLGGDTTQYQEMAARIRDLATQLEHYQEVVNSFHAEQQPQSPMSGMEQDFAQKMASQLSIVPPAANEVTEALKKTDEEMRQKPVDAQKASSAFTLLGKGILNAASVIPKLALQSISKGASLAGQGIKGLVSRLKSFGKHCQQSALTSNGLIKSLTGLKRMLLTRIKRTFISALFNSLKAGMSSFAQYSSAFNASMSGMKNSTTGLAGNLAVFAGNLINAVAPAISTIIDWISKAVEAVNGLLALLSGKGTFTVAKKGTDNYAKSLKSAGGAAKDLKNQVYGFDELNKADDNSSGGGGGGSGKSGSIDFEERSVSSLSEKIKKLGQDIKDAFTSGNFEKVGSSIAKALNGVIYSVDNWINTKLRPEAVKWSSIVARILNGFVADFDWAGLGKLFADGFNTVLDVLNTFLTTFNFDMLASQLGNGINGLIRNVDWSLLGTTIGNGFQAIHTTIWGTLSSIDWISLGNGLATGVNSMFEAVDWAKAATQVSDSVKGVIDGISTFLNKVNWQEIAADISTAIKAIDWAGLGESLNTGIQSAFNSVNAFMKGLDWKGIGAEVGTFVNGLDVGTWLTSFGTTVSELLTGAYDTVAGFIEGIEWTKLGADLWTGITGFIAEFDWSGLISSMFEYLGAAIGGVAGLVAGFAGKLWESLKSGWEQTKTYFSEYINAYGGDIIAGLWAGITNALKEVASWVHTNIIKPLVAGFESALGLENGTIANIASQLWENFKTAVSTAWEAVSGPVGEFFSGVWSSITGFFGTLGDTAKGIWDGFTTGISNGWNAVSGTVTSFMNDSWRTITGAFGTLGEIASNVWSDFQTGLSNGWNAVSGAVVEFMNNPWAAIVGVFSSIGDVATNLWEGLKNGLSDAWKNLKDTILKPFKDFWDSVKKFFGIASPSTEAASIGDFILQGLSKGLLDGVAAVLNTVADVFGRIWDAIKRIFGFGGQSEEQKDAKDAGKDIMTGLKDGITGDENTVKEAVKNAAKNALLALRAELGIPGESGASTKTKIYGGSLVTGLKDGLNEKGVQATFTAAANKVWNGAKEALNTAFGTSGENSPASKAKYVGQGIALGVNDGMNDKGKKTTFSSAADATIRSVKDAINASFEISSEGSASDKMKYAGQGAVNGIRDGMTDKATANTFASAANNVQSAIASALNASLGISGGGLFGGNVSAAKFKDLGKAVCQGVADGISSNISILETKAQSAASSALTKIQEYISETNGTTIGENMIIGIINGFNNYGQTLVNTLAHICNICVADAKKILGIASPSKVFTQIGEYTMEGLQIGLENSGKDAIDAVGGIAQSIMDEVPAGRIDLAFADSFDAAESKLSRIADVFTRIAEAITQMGGLHVPAIANGQFLPYSTRVSGNTANDPESAVKASELEDILVNAMSRAQESNNGDPVIIKLIVDGREMADVVTKYQRQQARAWG